MTVERKSLPAGDYWRVRALVNDVAAIENEARAAADGYKRRIAEAGEKARLAFVAQGFDPAKRYQWQDDTCEVVEVT